MRYLPAVSFFQLVYLYDLASALALPLLNATSTSSYLNFSGSSAVDEGHHWPIPGTQITLHLTLLPAKIPLPLENTLICLHEFAKILSLEPQSNYLDRIRVHTANDVEAIVSPAHCPGCGITYQETIKVLTGLWYYTSREKLLYVQRYGVFESRTGRMIAWGKLLTAPLAPGMSTGMDLISK